MTGLHEPKRFAYESMGTHWAVTIWDELDATVFSAIKKSIVASSSEFDHTYSRFIKTSLVWQLTEKRGITDVPKDLTTMLRLYKSLYDRTGGKCTPLIGFALSDMGYDADYSLKPKESIRPVPAWDDAIRIVDDTHIELKQSVLLDLGALGKGYFVDKIAQYLDAQGIRRFLVDGSGDVFYRGDKPIKAALEHPGDKTKAIGIIELRNEALCASAGNRRAWADYHHTIDPHSLTSPSDIIATWAKAETAALADGLATCLFLVEPEKLSELRFDYCLLNPAYLVKRSQGFTAELF